MLRQVRMNRWRDDAPPERIEAAIAALAELPGRIPELRGWYAAPSREGDDDFDFVVVADFDDEAAYARYLRHPEHVRVVSELVRPLLATTVRIRCER